MPSAQLDPEDLLRRLAPLAAEDITPLSGGRSSLTYAARIGAGDTARPAVVKVAPPGLPPTLNRDVLRQARLIRALAGTAVPIPEILWEDPGDPPEIPPLFVMSYAEGDSLEPLFDTDGELDDAVVVDRLRNAIATLAAMQGLDPKEIGLDDEPVVAPGAELDRWCRLLSTVDEDLAPGWTTVADKLRACEPASVRPAIVHGDFRLGNMLAVGPTITAVVDWEIWVIGDPRVDTGWFLANADPATYKRGTRYEGVVPSTAELIELCAAAGGEVSDIAWFQALACFKATATWAAIAKHNRRRPDPDAEVETMGRWLTNLLDRAQEVLG